MKQFKYKKVRNSVRIYVIKTKTEYGKGKGNKLKKIA